MGVLTSQNRIIRIIRKSNDAVDKNSEVTIGSTV